MARAVATVRVSEAHAALTPQLRVALLLAVVVAGAVALAGLAAVVMSQDVPGRDLSARAYPARVTGTLGPAPDIQPSPAGWSQPSDIVALGGRWFVLDTGNNRVLELNADGAIVQTLDQRREPRLALDRPMAIASDSQYLYVANSGAAEVVVLTPDGGLLRTVPLGRVAGDLLPARPIGLAATGDGGFVVSDAANHRVERYDGEGRLAWFAGAGWRASGDEGFNTPAGVALDRAGNVYVVDILNGRVVKLSADGKYLGQYGHLGDTGGSLGRPKDVALDAAGNVYVSDGLLDLIQVFGAAGEYRGFIGLKDPADSGSGALFRAPAGLAIAGTRLYVVDRLASVVVLELPSGE